MNLALTNRNQEKFKTGVMEVLQEAFPERFGQPSPEQAGKTLQAYLQFDWLVDHGFDEREINEIKFAHVYTMFFGHGTSGHLGYTVISKLADALSSVQQAAEENL